MLKKKERLTRKEFDRFFSIGKRLHTPSFQLIYAPSSSFHGSVVVGKKVSKKAVDRNRLRRRIYALLYTCNKTTPLFKTIIVITKSQVTALSKRALRDEIHKAIEKVVEL